MAGTARKPSSLETRATLLDAAARVFVERGFHGAAVREIAREAGFTNPVLYYHFGGKEELYDAVIRAAFERFEALMCEALEGKNEPLSRLHAIAAAHLRFGVDDPVRLRALYTELFRPRGAAPDLRFEELRAWTRSQIETVLRDGVRARVFDIADVPLARRIFMALLRGLLVEQAQDPKVRVLDESLANTVVRTFLSGISASGNAP
jgi:TetR/AcrR family acrAB operon transcriptional repressor